MFLCCVFKLKKETYKKSLFCDPEWTRTINLLLRRTTIVFTTISVCGLDYIITFDSIR